MTGTDSGRLWTFWHCFSVSCVLCSVVWLQIVTGLPSSQEKSPEPRGVVGKQVLLHVIKEGVENYIKRCWNGKMFSEQVFYFDADSKELWMWLSKHKRKPVTWGTHGDRAQIYRISYRSPNSLASA